MGAVAKVAFAWPNWDEVRLNGSIPSPLPITKSGIGPLDDIYLYGFDPSFIPKLAVLTVLRYSSIAAPGSTRFPSYF